MEIGTKVKINLELKEAQRIGINRSFEEADGTVTEKYTNGLDGHYVQVDGKPVHCVDCLTGLRRKEG